MDSIFRRKPDKKNVAMELNSAPLMTFPPTHIPEDMLTIVLWAAKLNHKNLNAWAIT